MAIFGDLGKFFKLGDTQTAVTAGAGFLGFDPIQSQIIGKTVAGFAPTSATGGGNQQSVPTGAGQRKNDTGAQEDSTSGNTIINLGQGNMPREQNIGAISGLIQGATKLLSSKGGQVATSVGLGLGASMLGGSSGQKPILTQSRRNKSKVRQLVNFMGIEGTADFLAQQGGRNVSPNDVVALLLRTFRNDGAFITKAQVRNLRRTTNRFKSLEKQVKEAVSMGTTRRPPVRRTVNRSTSIKI